MLKKLRPLFVLILTLNIPSFAETLDTDYEFSEIKVSAARGKGLARAEATAADIAKTNAINAEDSIKYLPSVNVRKRFIGDLNGLLEIRGVSNFQTTRSLVLADGYLPLSYYLQTRYNGAPRWALVSSDEILRSEIRYGAYEASDSGNALGGTINLVTKQPTHRQFELDTTYFIQNFSLYGDSSNPAGNRVHMGYADRFGDLSLYTFYDHQESKNQPMTFYGAATGTASTATVTGAFRDTDPLNAARVIYGDQGSDQAEIDLLKVKLGYDFGRHLKLQGQVASAKRSLRTLDKKTYLRDAQGGAVYSGKVTFNNENFKADGTQFGLSMADRDDILGGLQLKGEVGDGYSYELGGSDYSVQHDWTKASKFNPNDLSQTAANRLIGSFKSYEDTGWQTLDFKAGKSGLGADWLSAYVGGHYDNYTMRFNSYNSANWLSTELLTIAQITGGGTQTRATFGQIEAKALEHLTLTGGLRYEHWQAYGAFQNTPALALRFAGRFEERLSPKATARFNVGDFELAAGYAQATRYPIAEELFQNAFSYTSANISNPGLKPENGTQGTMTVGWSQGASRMQASYYVDDVYDAIIYQTDSTVTPNQTTYVNVDRARTQGLELSGATAGLFGFWDLNGSCTLQDPRVVEDNKFTAYKGNQLPQTTQARFVLINTAHLGEHADLTLASRYFSKQYALLSNADSNGDTYGGQSSGLVFDLKAGCEWDGIRLGLGIDNLLSAQYYDVHPYPHRTYFVNAAAKF